MKREGERGYLCSYLEVELNLLPCLKGCVQKGINENIIGIWVSVLPASKHIRIRNILTIKYFFDMG